MELLNLDKYKKNIRDAEKTGKTKDAEKTGKTKDAEKTGKTKRGRMTFMFDSFEPPRSYVDYNSWEAWKDSEEIRNFFEATFNMNTEPSEHMGFICKCCGERFSSDDLLSRVEGHACLHSERGDVPYSTPYEEPTPNEERTRITGEEACILYSQLMERFNIVIPEVKILGPKDVTWEFECKYCKERLLNSTPHRDLMGHSARCSREFAKSASGNVN